MVDNPELQELYRTIADVLDGYNKTHGAQVSYVDFEARVPDYAYSGSVVCREYPESIIDYHYRDLREDDFDWYTAEDWAKVCVDRKAVAAKQRRDAQKAHREGTLRYAPWLTKADPYPEW